MASSYLDTLKKLWKESEHLTNPPITATEIEDSKKRAWKEKERQYQAYKDSLKYSPPPGLASIAGYPVYSPVPEKVLGVDLLTIVQMKHFFESIGCDLTPEAIAALTKECRQ